MCFGVSPPKGDSMKIMLFQDDESGRMRVYHADSTCGGVVFSNTNEDGCFLFCSTCDESLPFDHMNRLFMKPFTPSPASETARAKRGNGRLH